MRARVADLLHIPERDVSIKAKTPEGLNHDGTAVAHVTVLLESLPEPGGSGAMTAEAEDPEEVAVVVRNLIGDDELYSTRRLGRKPAFDTDDLT